MADKSVFADVLKDNELLRNLIERSVDGLIAIDHRGKVIYANPAAIDMFADRMPELTGSIFGIPAINEAVELVLPRKAEMRHVEMRASEFMWNGEALYLASLREITLRKQLFDSLQQREKMLQNVFDILPIGLWFADSNGRLERGNKAGIKIWGSEPKVGIESYGVFKARRLPEGKEIEADDWALAHAIRDKKTTLDEMLEIECFDGSKKIILNYVAPIIDENEKVQGAVVVNNDITEQMKAEEALRESESHFRTLANSGQALIWTSGLDKNCNYFNQIWLDFTGRTLEQELGAGWTEGVHPDDLQACIDTYSKAFDRREKFSMVYRIRRHDGEYRWIQDDGSPRFNSHGKFLGYIGHCLDVSERMQYERRLAESESLFRSLIEGAPDAIIVYTTKNFVYVNAAAVDLFGASSQEQLLATPVLDLFPHAERSATQLQIDNLLEKKLPVTSSEKTMLRLDKSVVHVEVSAVPITFAGKASALSFVRNIEERVAARTERENLMTQLAHAQKMESIGALAGGVAHDFNNMLQVILGETEFAIEESLDNRSSELAASLAAIKKAAERSAELTRKLLMFARKQLYSPKILNINEVIDGMLKMLRRMIGENIELIWKPGTAIWQIEMDPSQLDQVLANLVVNARDAIDNVGTLVIETNNIEIDKEMCREVGITEAGDYVDLSISDTGCGMKPEVLARIFEPFFTTKEIGKGTGLGLATVYGIIGQNGGSIKAYSEYGIGTTFKIYLPRAKGDNSCDSSKLFGAAAADLTGSETILLVEDEIQILNYEKILLERLGYKLLFANDPASALNIAQEYPDKIDLLITDVIMPGMNGKELQQKITMLHPQIKCIFVSGYSTGVIEHHGILPDNIDFIEKPFTASKFAEKIRNALRKPE